MALVTRTYPKHPPMVTMTGARPWQYHCTWLVEADGRMPGANVIEFGRLSANGIPVPNYGDTLNMTVDGSQIVDGSVYALDFSSRMVGGAEHQTHVYEVDVTWREPNSLPGSASGGIGVRGEHPDALPFRDQPTQRPPEVWVEFESITSQQYTGYNLDVLAGRTGQNAAFSRSANTLGPLVNANGEAIEPQPWERTIAVLCSRSYVTTYQAAMDLNATYENTINSATFLGFLTHYVRYRRAETGFPEYYNGQRYYELTVRVDIGRGEWYHKFPNESSWYYDPPNGITTIEGWQGNQIAGHMIPIKLDGTYADAGPVTLTYRLYDAVSYAPLVTYFQ